MSQQLLRRAWDALDSFKQAYPENWHEDDQQVMDDLLKADLDLSAVKRTWVGLTAEEKSGQRPFGNGLLFNSAEAQVWEIAVDYAEAKLKEKNT